MERAETTGLAVAVVGHAALIAALLVGLGQAAPPAPPAPVEVSFVAETALTASSPSQEAAQQATSPDPAPLTDSSAEPEPAPAAEPVPAPVPAPRPEPRPEPQPQPKPEPRPVAKPEPQPAPKPKAAAKPKPAPKPAPKPTARTAASTPAKPSAKPAAKPPTRSAAANPKPSARPGTGSATRPTPTAAAAKPRGSRLGSDFLKGVDSASEGRSANPPAAIKSVTPAVQRSLAQAIARRIKPHWRAPPGVDVELLVTVVEFRLTPDGRVIGRPVVKSQTGQNSSNQPQVPLHAEAAISAILKGQPYELPADFYDQWKYSSVRFDRRL